MKLQYLGTAAAEAIPALFCHCDLCDQARKLGGKNIRHRSGMIINDCAMIDFPPDIYDQTLRLGLDLGKVDDLFITHSHFDHFDPSELNLRHIHTYCELRDENGNDKAPLRLYGNAGVVNALHTVLRLEETDRLPYLSVQTLSYFDTVTTPTGLTFTFLPAQHKQDESSGFYLIEDGKVRVLYAHDTGAILPEVVEFLRGKPLDLISFDCCQAVHVGNRGHMGLEENAAAAEALRAVGAVTDHTRLIANHFSHYYTLLHDDLVEAAKAYGLEVSFDGMIIEL